MRDLQNFPADLLEKQARFHQLAKKIPKYIAGAADKMKDANFAAQGFITNGKADRWPPRKTETTRSQGKRILHGVGTLQNSVKAQPLADHVRVGVDLGKVPYARIHNEGGAIIQYVKPHTRQHPRSGKRHQVKSFARKARYPKRQYLGFTPDIITIAEREIRYQIDKIMQS